METASIGFCIDGKGQYYLQIITAQHERHYFVRITREQRLAIARQNNMDDAAMDIDTPSANEIIS